MVNMQSVLQKLKVTKIYKYIIICINFVIVNLWCGLLQFET